MVISMVLAAGALPSAGAETAGEVYTPGLGDIMGAIQMRHAQLWFAGKLA